jgi:Flp pilus assembly protein TadG
MTTRLKTLPSVLRQLLRDTKAVAAVEFALLLPLLFMFLEQLSRSAAGG